MLRRMLCWFGWHDWGEKATIYYPTCDSTEMEINCMRCHSTRIIVNPELHIKMPDDEPGWETFIETWNQVTPTREGKN